MASSLTGEGVMQANRLIWDNMRLKVTMHVITQKLPDHSGPSNWVRRIVVQENVEKRHFSQLQDGIINFCYLV